MLDAGHGGDAIVGLSTPVGVIGPNGTREKWLTLDVARRVQRLSLLRGQPITLTRERDENLSLRRRISTAHDVEATRFVSLHFNGSDTAHDQGGEAWVHPNTSRGSRRLADTVLSRVSQATGLPSRGVKTAPMAILDPSAHRPDVSACLVEVSFLSDPHEEARLAVAEYREQIADALASALCGAADAPSFSVREECESLDVWYEVPLVEQLTGMSCWAAAAAMLVGWRDCISIDAAHVARGIGGWEAYRDGLETSDVDVLAAAWGLEIEPIRMYTVASLRDLMVRYGPLWIGEASPGLHVVVIAGMYGDGTSDGTFVRVADPWPVGRGDRYTVRFAEFARNVANAATLSGVSAQVLHTGGSRAGHPGGAGIVAQRRSTLHIETR